MQQLEDETRSDRVFQIETDDENDEAERSCENEEEYTESDVTHPRPSRDNSVGLIDPYSVPWPQSYRETMNVYTSITPSVSFIKDSPCSSLIRMRGSQTTMDGCESSLTTSLINESSLEEGDVPVSTLPVRLSATSVTTTSHISEVPQPRLCSYFQALLNATNGLCGIGILSTPYALREGGWLSLSILVIFGIITWYTGILLKRCLESSPGLQTYPDIGQAAFGIFGRICIAVVLYMELYSSCVELLIMMSDNLSAMFPHFNLDVAGIHLNSYQLFSIISTIIILPTACLPNLRLLSYISVGGVVMLAVVILCMLWVGFVNDIGFHMGGTAFNVARLPVTIGIYSFCYGSHSIFPNIYSSMKEPSQFPSILLISFCTACVLYAGVAICGFLMFGDSTNAQFTLNMPKKYSASVIASWMVVLTPFTKYALTLTPIACGLEELLPTSKVGSYKVSLFIRITLAFSTLVIALAVPYFGSLMALIGSLLVMLVSVIFPCACYIQIGREKLTISQIGVCGFIIVIGVLCSIIGTYSALATITNNS